MRLSATAAWTDIDVSADTTGTSKGVFFERTSTTADYDWGLRRNGSTDARINDSQTNFLHVWGFIGVDASEICEGYIENVDVDFFLVGYVTDGFTARTNAANISPGNTAVYEDLPAIETGATGAIVEVVTGAQHSFNLRKNGLSTDIYRLLNQRSWWIGETDTGQVIEGKISDFTVEFFENGYFTAIAGGGAPAAVATKPTLLLMGAG